MKTVFLYVLVDPRDGRVRYLGKSDNPFDRLKEHLRDRKPSHKVNWIRQLRAEKLIPFVELLDEVPEADWGFWEREYLRVFRAVGVPLTNQTPGGEGNSSPRSEETRKKMSESAKKKFFSPSHRAAISKANSGEGNAHFGKALPDEVKRKISESRKRFVAAGGLYPPFSFSGRKHSAETRAKMRAAWALRRKH